MEKRFVVPAVSFIAAVLIWVAFFVLSVMSSWVQELAPWQKVALCLVVSGLILFSGVRCHQVGGPRVGGIVRSVVLLLMALFTFWKVGIVAACVLLAAAIILGSRTLMGSYQPEAAEDSTSTSSQATDEAK